MLAGYAQSNITPEPGAPLDGFIARLNPSSGVDAPLLARALWLEHDPARCLLVGLDLLGVDEEFADKLVSSLAARLGIARDHVIVACSHTHSGPMTLPLRGLGSADEDYLDFVARRVGEAAEAAAWAKRRARVSWGTAPVQLGVNRREVRPQEQSVVLGCNPNGPMDKAERLLHLVSDSASIVLLEHACHPYFLHDDSTLISPDFFGHAAKTLRSQGHHAIYLNGCAGDLAPAADRDGAEGARAAGRELAGAVLSACRCARSENEADLHIASARVDLPYDQLYPVEQLRRDLEKADRTVRDEVRGIAAVQARLRAAWQQWLAELKDSTWRESALPPRSARVSIVRIGRGAIVALPGEVFFEIGQHIASRIKADPVCVAAYTHGYIGYVPTPEAFAEGGYEVEEAHRYMGLWRVSPDAGGLLEDEVVRLWRQLGGQSR